MTLVCKSVIWDGIVNPIYGCGVKMAPDINPIYAGNTVRKCTFVGRCGVHNSNAINCLSNINPKSSYASEIRPLDSITIDNLH